MTPLFLVACFHASLLPPWKDPRIHTLGNHGPTGMLHALAAPLITSAIDRVAYEGLDVRGCLRSSSLTTTVDLGCGVGLSTSENGIGVDSSREMLRVARALHPRKTFFRGLAEKWGETDMAQTVTVAFLLHEQSRARRALILKNAYRLCACHVVVMDIHPSYRPSATMLAGEPYIEEYLNAIDEELHSMFCDTVTSYDLVHGRVRVWNITKSVFHE